MSSLTLAVITSDSVEHSLAVNMSEFDTCLAVATLSSTSYSSQALCKGGHVPVGEVSKLLSSLAWC